MEGNMDKGRMGRGEIKKTGTIRRNREKEKKKKKKGRRKERGTGQRKGEERINNEKVRREGIGRGIGRKRGRKENRKGNRNERRKEGEKEGGVEEEGEEKRTWLIILHHIQKDCPSSIYQCIIYQQKIYRI